MNFSVFRDIEDDERRIRWMLISGSRTVITSDQTFLTDDEARSDIADFKKTASGVKFAKVHSV